MEKNNEVKQCLLCMEYHELELIKESEKTIFKGEEIKFTSMMYYCKNTDECLITEDLLKANSLNVKDAYRTKMGLLTSKEIQDIRIKYNISQKDLSRILDWGELTVTRYENHQVQDRAHDDVLLCIKENPLHLYNMILKNKGNLSENSYKKILKEIRNHLPESKSIYLRNSIIADYAEYYSPKYQGNKELDLDKVVDSINYLAENIDDLNTVKLMKLLWYSDSLAYKEYNTSITGLVYFKEMLGALPKAYDRIILLEDIKSIEEPHDYYIAKYFVKNKEYKIKKLEESEKEILDRIVKRLGSSSSKEIVEKMHKEEAYIHTKEKHPINYEYSKYIEL